MEPTHQIVHDPTTLGAHLRRLRQSRQITIESLASRVALSKGYISLVESGKRTPHWLTLMKVLHALNETLCSFLTWGGNIPLPKEGIRFGREQVILIAGSEPDEWGLVPNADSEGYTWILTPHRPGMQSEVIRFRLPPRSAWTPELLTLPAYGTLFGLEGEALLELEVEEEQRDEFTIGKGEVLQFDCNRPHRFRNYTDIPAEILLTIAPAVF